MRHTTSRRIRLVGCAVALALGGGMLAVPAASAAGPALTITAPSLVFTKGTTRIAVATPETQVAYIVTDEQGLAVTSGTAPVSGGSGSIDLSSLGPGYYNLTVGAGATLDKTTFAVLAPLPAGAISPSSPFGVGLHTRNPYNAGLIPTVAQVGFGTVRFDLKWADVEKTPGTYSFPADVDSVVNTLDGFGLTPLPIATYKNPLYDGNHTPNTPAGEQAMGRFMSQILTHYPTVKGIEVYNEFNISTFNDTGCLTAACYAPMLAAAYQQVKHDHPDAVVAGPSTFKAPTDFYNDLWNLGGLNNLDVVSVHPYVYAAPPEDQVSQQLAPLNQSVRDHNGGQTKPVWITEDGWPNGTAPNAVNEATTADNLIRSEALAFANGVTQYDWYDLLDDGTDATNVEDNFGLLRQPTAAVTAPSPKPALVTQAVTIRQLAGLSFSGSDDVAAPVYSERFGTGAATTRVMWAPDTATVSLAAAGQVTVTDEFGRVKTLTPSGGRVSVDLTGHPVFVKGAASDIRTTTTPQFSATAAASTAVGDAVPVTLTVDRRHQAGGTAREATFRFDDTTFTVPSRPGKRTTTTVDLPASAVLGNRNIVGEAGLGKPPQTAPTARTAGPEGTGNDGKNGKDTKDGKNGKDGKDGKHGGQGGQVNQGEPAAQLFTSTQTVPATTVAVRPRTTTDPFTASLSVDITNHRRSGDATVGSIAWSLGAHSGTETAVPPVPAGTTSTVNIPIPDAAPWQSYPFKATVSVGGSVVFAQSGNTGFNPITPQGSTTVPLIDLSTDGKATYTGRPYGGAPDLSGTVALHSAPGGLSMTADITDDVFSQKNPASTMYLGDSLQLSVTPALPGASPNRVEFGIAKTANGPEVYSFAAAAGQSTGPVTGTDAAVTRTGNVTHYSVTLPWSLLGLTAPPTGPFGISVLANDDDNDGLTRPGIIEWCGGIATSKATVQTCPAEIVSP